VKHYSYFFTRQDISPEQQIVQTAHSALCLGVRAKEGGATIDPDTLNFVVVGVRDLAGLLAVQEILQEFNFLYEIFYESHMRDEPTSIAVYPVSEHARGILKAFNTLKIKS